MSDVTRILSQMESGDPTAAEQLFPLVYQELRRLAKIRMASERADHSLQATGLVHEAYLRLVDIDVAQHWDSRGHFFTVAAETMRRILIDNARRRRRAKHGGDFHRESPDVLDELVASLPDQDLLALDEAMEKLAIQDESAAHLIKLRFYAGLSMPQIAQALGRSLRSIEREWRYARSWLHREISAKDTPVT
ncbi:ECF-type sigma factor [Pirellulaceae bacterium SH467]